MTTSSLSLDTGKVVSAPAPGNPVTKTGATRRLPSLACSDLDRMFEQAQSRGTG
ncbi:hypothetical protein SAMN05444007_107245 [Cribrihabitans marinus]|uniref:Uncharacterized protein n=1 Tax=Cribrihabitans marinus TaxID=1227549 RepID=A0A1H7BYH7_9RHOB|nr:hypothetical protein [Cribrihabitans marinus]GGH33301.1 hypothetical protein GCM10010973_25300 [Cribrihabitans marinus]SEJ82438.1 hypothetical protein SAMN05444007_107245 [Cribrihabitans marinus]